MAEQAKKVTPIIIEGFEINGQNVTFQKLQEFSLTLYEKLLSQRKERNFLMFERDKYRTFLENVRHETNVSNAISKNMEDELEKNLERYRNEMKEIEQEIKYILYDHNIDLTDLQSWEESIMENADKKNLEEELELLEEKRKLKELCLEQEIKNEEELACMKQMYQNDILKLEKHQDEVMINKEMEFKRNLNNTIEQFTLRHEMEMSELEERKNTHLGELKKVHTNRLNEMKDFFNTISSENLAVISCLKQSLESMKKNKTTITVEVKQLKQENKNMKEPLEKSKAEVKNLMRQLVNYEKDLRSLKNNKYLLSQTLKETNRIKRKSTEVQKEIQICEMQLPNLFNSACAHSLIEFKNESEDKRVRLENLIKDLTKDLKNKYWIIEQLKADPDIAKALSEENFEYWNPKSLSYELSVICKAHQDLIKTLEQKLTEFCIAEPELSEKILEEGISLRSAALISKQ